MAATYHDDQIQSAPPWLQGPAGQAFLGPFGDAKDWLAAIAKQAVKGRMPNLCPADALPLIGQERGVDRGSADSDAAYRARLIAAWNSWLWAGTPYGMLQAFYAAGYPSVLIQTQNAKQYSLASTYNPATPNPASDLVTASMAAPVHLGGSPERWSQFAVLITKPWPSWWGSTAPADGSSDQQTAAALVKKWKPGHMQCVALKAIAGPTWGVNMTWNAFTWGAGTSTIWTPPAT